MQQLRRDPRFLFFASGAALALVISAPFTFAIVSPFHQAGERLSAGWWVGGLLSAGLVILLEAGAVGAKIARVTWLSLALLALTFVGNLVTGSDYWQRAALAGQPMLAAWRASWFGWLPPVLYAAIVPVLLYTFLHFAITRADELLVSRPRTVEGEVAELRRDVRALAGYLRETLPALPEQASYARPELVRDAGTQAPVTPEKPARHYACPSCGQSLNQGQYGAAVRHGRCKSCPPSLHSGLDAG
jgi:predicted RNA-binding Zn-ribbon protein involved in translation (DUF1610 family)